MDLNNILKKIKAQKDRKFDESIELISAVNLAKSSESGIRMELNLPHNFGEAKKVLVLCDKNEVEAAAKADFVGLEEYVEKIKGGWKEFDVVIATPTVMPKIAILGKFLGASGMMPNPKNGTVTKDLAKAVDEFKSGKSNVKTNKGGQIQITVAKKSMTTEEISANIDYTVKLLSENVARNTGMAIKSVYVKTSMGTPYRLI